MSEDINKIADRLIADKRRKDKIKRRKLNFPDEIPYPLSHKKKGIRYKLSKKEKKAVEESKHTNILDVLNERKKILSKGKPTRSDFNRANHRMMEERCVWIAQRIRTGESIQKIVFDMQEEFDIGKIQARRCLERVYRDFQEMYEPQDHQAILAEHAETLREGMKRALEASRFVAFEKISRQYAEMLGLIICSKTSVPNVQNIDKQLVVREAPTSLLKELTDMTHAKFLEQFVTGSDGPNQQRKEIVSESIPVSETRDNSSKEALSVLNKVPHDDKGG